MAKLSELDLNKVVILNSNRVDFIVNKQPTEEFKEGLKEMGYFIDHITQTVNGIIITIYNYPHKEPNKDITKWIEKNRGKLW